MTALQRDGVYNYSPRFGWMRALINNGCSMLLIALLLSLVATPARAQAWSRGIQDLPISTSECMRRAALGLQAEGYGINGKGDSYIGGGKGIHAAVVTCDAGPGGRTLTNIVVVSCGAADGGVSGGERIKLQQRMQNAGGGAASIGNWRAAGTGDCSGYDKGSSQGSNPDPGQCNASTAGWTAVCWGTWCTYKNIKADSCKGGGSPGNMFTCNLPSSPGGPAGGGAASIGNWSAAGTGDCSGYDKGSSQGPNPDPGQCNASTAGWTAVCWGTWCTYKNIDAASCKGGGSPGNMFACNLSTVTGGRAGGGCADPRTLATMDQWLAGANPPDNQRSGWSLRYEAWGRLVGRTPTNTLAVSGPPETQLSRCEWLWAHSTSMRSTNLGTLREYLQNRLR